jgi:hypothetical protein
MMNKLVVACHQMSTRPSLVESAPYFPALVASSCRASPILPLQHGPWTVIGIISPHKSPPHNFSRDAIEKAIKAKGFQLWRLLNKKQA